MPAFDLVNNPDGARAAVLEYRNRQRTVFRGWVNRVMNVWEPLVVRRDKTFARYMLADLQGTELSEGAKKRATISDYQTAYVAESVTNMTTRLARAEVKIEVALTDKPEQQVKSSVLEKALRGWLHQQDDQTRDSAMGQSFLRRAAAFAAQMGKVAGRVQSELKGGTVEVIWEIWDPITVYHDFGIRHQRRVVHEEMMDATEVASLLEAHKIAVPEKVWESFKTGQPIALAEYFLEDRTTNPWDVWRAVIAGDEVVDGPRILRGEMWERLPVYYVAMNGLPAMHQDFTLHRSAIVPQQSREEQAAAIHSEFVLHHARPWFADIEAAVGTLNLAKSLELDALWMAIHPPVIVASPDGTYIIKDEILYPGTQIQVQTGEQVISYLERRIPDLSQFSVIRSAEQDVVGAYPRHLISGEAAFPGQSGTHLHLQQDVQEIPIMPYADGLADWLTQMMQETIRQVRAHAKDEMVKVRLSARATSGEQMGKWFEEEFDVKQFPVSTALRIRLSPQLPRDDARAIDLYNKSVNQGPNPMLDADTGRVKFGGVDDPVEMGRRIRRDQINASQVMLNEAILEAKRQNALQAEALAQAENDPARKDALERTAYRIWNELADMEAQLRGTQQGFEQAREQGAFPPETLPGTMAVENPVMNNLAAGEAPAGMQGRPGVRAPTNGKRPSGAAKRKR